MAKLKGVITSSANYLTKMSGRRAGVKHKSVPQKCNYRGINSTDELMSEERESVYTSKSHNKVVLSPVGLLKKMIIIIFFLL